MGDYLVSKKNGKAKVVWVGSLDGMSHADPERFKKTLKDAIESLDKLRDMDYIDPDKGYEINPDLNFIDMLYDFKFFSPHQISKLLERIPIKAWLEIAKLVSAIDELDWILYRFEDFLNGDVEVVPEESVSFSGEIKVHIHDWKEDELGNEISHTEEYPLDITWFAGPWMWMEDESESQE